MLDRALADADGQGILGAAVTPFVLGRIAASTAGRSVPANLALAERNAAVAAEIAVAVAQPAAGLDVPTSSPLRSTVTGPSSLTTITVASGSS